MKKNIMSAVLACMMLLTACSKNPEKNDNAKELSEGIVLKVGDSEMTAGQFQFFLDDIKNQMQGTELSEEESWETAEIEGKKAIDIAKERAYESAVEYLSYIEVAKKKGLSYTEDDMNSIKSQIDTSYFEEYPNSEEIINLICEANLYITELQKGFVNEQPVQDSEVEAYFNEHKDELESKYMRAKHVLLLTQDDQTKEPLSEEEIAQKKKQADEILARAKNGEDFDTLVSEYSEDPGSKNYPQGYVFTSGEMVQEFEDCVKSLKAEEIGFAQTSYGYHIIKRLDLDASSCKDVITNSIYSEKFKVYIDNLMEEYNIEVIKNDEEYNKIK